MVDTRGYICPTPVLMVQKALKDRPAMVETTAFGAAALAGLACGMWSSLEELQALRRSDRVFLPQRIQSECDEEYRLWKRAVSRAADWIEH